MSEHTEHPHGARARIETRLAHLGRDPSSEHGVVNPPVYRASTIIHPTMEDMLAGAQRRYEQGAVTYGRFGTPTHFALEDAMAALDGGHRGMVLPSGLAAVVAAVTAFVGQGDHLLMADTVYGPARTLANGFLARMGVETTFYDPLLAADDLAKQLRPNTKLVYAESPGSYTFEVQDIPALSKLCRNAGIPLLMDNTWATPLFFPAIERGVDVAIYAGTKYIVGHSDAMLGVLVTTEATDGIVRRNLQDLGYSTGPDDVYLALRGLRTMEVRLSRHQENALTVAEWLQNRPEVERVMYPALPDDPGHALWRRDFLGASGLMGVLLKPVSDPAVFTMVDHLEYFGIGASWGGFESLVRLIPMQGYRSAVPWTSKSPCLRLHIGLENPKDLIKDLEAGFDRLKRAAEG